MKRIWFAGDCRCRVRGGRVQGYRQDQDWRNRRLGLYRRRCGRRACLCIARNIGGSGGSEGGKSGGPDSATSRRTRYRVGAGIRQRVHHQRPIQQRDDLRPENVGQSRRTSNRPESGFGLLRAEDQAHLYVQWQVERFDSHRPQDERGDQELSVGRKPEECAVDGTGKIYANLENSSEIVEIDAAKTAILRHASLAPCESPSGLAIDIKNKRLFSACDNKMMAVTDMATLKVIATPPIGPGTDGAGFDPGLGLAFSSNGGDGTLSVVKQVNGKYETVENVPTERGARTMTVDPKNHRVYLLAAEYGPAPQATPGKKARPPILPDSFHILVVGK